MDSYTPFTEVGFTDPLVGAEIFRLLKVGEGTFKDPLEFRKLKEISEFLSGYEDAPFVVSRALARNPGRMTPMDSILSYVKLQKERIETSKRLKDLEKEISYYE